MALFKTVLFCVIMFVALNEACGVCPDTIIKACNNSLHRDFCISSLSKARGALQANLTKLSVMAVGLSCREAKPVSRLMEKLRKGNPYISELQECAELLQDTRNRLHHSEIKLRQLSDANFKEHIQDALASLYAAETNQDTCVSRLQGIVVFDSLIFGVMAKMDYLAMLIDTSLAAVCMIVEQGHS